MGGDRPTVAEALTRVIASRTRSDLARELGIQASTITRWASGEYRITYEDIARVEDACGVRRGWVLQCAGFVECPNSVSVREAIEADPELTGIARDILADVYESARRRYRSVQAAERVPGD